MRSQDEIKLAMKEYYTKAQCINDKMESIKGQKEFEREYWIYSRIRQRYSLLAQALVAVLSDCYNFPDCYTEEILEKSGLEVDKDFIVNFDFIKVEEDIFKSIMCQ